MKNTESIHYIAEQFLRDWSATHANTLVAQHLLDGVRQIILLRERTPRYFCGFKARTKAPVWSYSRQHAKSIDHQTHEVWQAALYNQGEITFPIWDGVKH